MSGAVTPNSVESGRRHHSITTPVDRIIVQAAQRFGGQRAKEVERFIKFGFVGLLGFAIDFTTVLILQNTAFPPVNDLGEPLAGNVAIGTSIAFVLAVLSNFVWNRLWTYPDSRSQSVPRQLIQFIIVSVIGWAIRTIWIDNSYKFLGVVSTSVLQSVSADYAPTLLDQDKLGTMVALLFGVIVVMLWNFLANRYWTYNDIE